MADTYRFKKSSVSALFSSLALNILTTGSDRHAIIKQINLGIFGTAGFTVLNLHLFPIGQPPSNTNKIVDLVATGLPLGLNGGPGSRMHLVVPPSHIVQARWNFLGQPGAVNNWWVSFVEREDQPA